LIVIGGGIFIVMDYNEYIKIFRKYIDRIILLKYPEIVGVDIEYGGKFLNKVTVINVHYDIDTSNFVDIIEHSRSRQMISYDTNVMPRYFGIRPGDLMVVIRFIDIDKK
jgi:hypothetical protein